MKLSGVPGGGENGIGGVTRGRDRLTRGSVLRIFASEIDMLTGR